MNTNSIANSVLDEALEECIQYFRNNRSYRQLDEIQQSRCNINLVKVDMVNDIKETAQLKHMTYNNLYKGIYITLPLKYIVPGERLNPKTARRIRYQLIPMEETIDILENMADVFVDGIKLGIKYVKIALFDDYFVLEIPYEHKYANSIDVLIRPTLMEKYSDTTSITIDKSELINKDKYGFIAYADGSLTEKVSILEYDSYYIYKCNEAITKSFELCFIRNLVKYGRTKLTNNFIRFDKFINKFPISARHILPFRLDGDRSLCNLNLEAKTSNVFMAHLDKEQTFFTEYNIYYVYEERDNDINLYHDNYKWYVDNVLKGKLDNLSMPKLLPEFMNEFGLYDKDISLANYVSEGDKNLIDYNYKKMCETIQYDQELLIEFRRILEDKLSKYILKSNDFITIDADYLENNVRTESNKDLLNTEHHIRFPSPMVLIKIPNYENNHFNIYINGLRNHFHTIEFDELGISYVYILKNRLPEGSIIQIEKFKFSKNLKKVEFVGNGSKSINITNAKLNGLVGDGGTYNLKLLQTSGTEKADISISSVEYNEVTDVLKIQASNTLLNGILYTLYNLNYISIYKYETRRKGENLQLDISSMNALISDKKYFRVFKNGREIHKDKISIQNNTLQIDAKYTIYELIEIEHSPIVYEEMYMVNSLPQENSGELDLYKFQRDNQNAAVQYFSNGLSQYITVNGRRLNKDNYKYWCSQGATIHDIKSRKWCRIVNETYIPIYNLLERLMETFKVGNHLYDKYIVDTMEGGPIEDIEDDCLDENIERVGELYYDLYKEFLKHNIIDIGAKMPEYIAIKYSGLIDTSRNNSIMIDASDKQLYWMPLDATMKHEEQMINILGLYYKLMEDMQTIQVIDPDDIPDEIYEKYKELFQNNVLVLQIPDIPPM